MEYQILCKLLVIIRTEMARPNNGMAYKCQLLLTEQALEGLKRFW